MQYTLIRISTELESGVDFAGVIDSNIVLRQQMLYNVRYPLEQTRDSQQVFGNVRLTKYTDTVG